MLYRKLFANLSGHKAVLLIDATLSDAIAAAVAALDIEIHQYQWTGKGIPDCLFFLTHFATYAVSSRRTELCREYDGCNLIFPQANCFQDAVVFVSEEGHDPNASTT